MSTAFLIQCCLPRIPNHLALVILRCSQEASKPSGGLRSIVLAYYLCLFTNCSNARSTSSGCEQFRKWAPPSTCTSCASGDPVNSPISSVALATEYTASLVPCMVQHQFEQSDGRPTCSQSTGQRTSGSRRCNPPRSARLIAAIRIRRRPSSPR